MHRRRLMGSLIPSPYPVVHVERQISDTDIDPDTGNPVTYDVSPPKVRRAQSISQIGMRGSSRQIFDAEHLKRIDTDLHLGVANPGDYSPGDAVILFPDLDDNGEWVPGSGVQFFVDGLPNAGQFSPWPVFTKAFGGVVRLKRVT